MTSDERAVYISDQPAESYLESLSDLLVGLLFLFIIVLMSFTLTLTSAIREKRDEVNQLKDAYLLRKDMLNRISSELSHHGMRLHVDSSNGVLRLPESLLFESGSADFDQAGLRKVQVVARAIAKILPCYASGGQHNAQCPSRAHPILDALFIEGHTDTVPITGGPFKDNWELSAARARNTYEALTQAADGLRHAQNANGQLLLSISAYGSTRPVLDVAPSERLRDSRRIDLRFVIGAPREHDLVSLGR